MRLLLRIVTLAALAAAVAGPTIPDRSGPRTRVYVVDASASMRARGAPESLDLSDCLRLVSYDVARSRPQDRSALILVGAKPVVAVPPTPRDDFKAGAPAVDPAGTDLDGALAQAALLAGDGDIVVLSDGRATVRPRPISVSTIAAGPIDPVDARIDAVDLPAAVPPGQPYRARVTVAATAACRAKLLGRDVVFEGAGAQDLVFDGLRGPLDLRLEVDDACTENNAVRIDVLERTDAPRILSISGKLDQAPEGYDVIVVNGADLTLRDQERIAACVRAGAGLVLLGGSRSYARGGWSGLEPISPLWNHPDDRVALVVVFDRSGSMSAEIPGTGRTKKDVIVAAVADALSVLKDDDEIAAVPFSGEPTVVPFHPGSRRGDLAESLRSVQPGGPTRIVPALTRAIDVLNGATAGKKRLLLLTDGETEETAYELKAAGARLRDIGLTTVGTAGVRGKLEHLPGDFFGINDLRSFSLDEVLARSRDLELEPKTTDAGWPRPARINRTTAKPAAEILARADGAPLVAVTGRVLAATFAFEQGWAGGYAGWSGLGALIRRVTPPTPAGPVHAVFEGDDLVISLAHDARVTVGETPVTLTQRGSSRWEGRLRRPAGTHPVRVDGRAAAVAVLPCAPELAALGVDPGGLDRIGPRVRRLEDLPPRRGGAARRELRPWLLALALLCFLADIAVGTFVR